MKKIICFTLLTFCAGLHAQVSFSSETLTTVGSNRAVVDMNGDFLDDVVSVTSNNINIFYQEPASSAMHFSEVNISTSNANYTPSWSLAAGDYDHNGFNDLLYAGSGGVTFMKANDTGTAYSETSGNDYVFCQRSNFADINNDGYLDAFVCHDIEPNVYYINDGNGNLIFQQGGLGDFPSGGNYGSVWIDYNNDRNLDLFIAKCGGSEDRRTNQIFRNNGDGTYTEVGQSTNLADPIQTWSSAWGDYDNDGDMDVFVGASTGNHKLMRNNGNETFTDVSSASGIWDLYETGIENATYDFDNDGNLDIASNGNILWGNGDLTFTISYNILSYDNGSFGDLNADGFIDSFSNDNIYWNNVNTNNWFTMNLIGIQSNANGIGARIELTTDSGTQIRDVRSGQGFRFMSTLNIHFGIGTNSSISSVIVYWPSGTIDVLQDPEINQAFNLTEGETLDIEETKVTNLILYPNPASDRLHLSEFADLQNAVYTIFDITGKKVLNNKLTSSEIDVSKLSAGSYILRIENHGNIKTQKFFKK
ncbi:MAG TPA: FG-GAP-like repeat-containing protein [Flavobacteriaceae bacterium]|nr:FG-GAP-like repeat-containing protein [Flavobacteriaceae bacterium]